jgi:hypothetical protein
MDEHIIVVVADAALIDHDHDRTPISAHLCYTIKDPVAVSVTLIPDNPDHELPQSTWTFARDLLDTALSTTEPQGIGSVTVTYIPQSDLLYLSLRDDVDGFQHTVFIDGETVARFVTLTLGVTPTNQEAVDIDGTIEALEQWGRRQ